jgi:hypothetical protein
MNKIFVGLLVIIIAACDFDNPSDFKVPTWFIDIKLPLVSKRFPMGDLVDSIFIFPTDDTLGFQIFFGDSIDPPFEPEQIQTRVLFDGGSIKENIPATDIGGIDGSAIPIEPVTIPPDPLPPPLEFPLSVVQYGAQYPGLSPLGSFSFPLDNDVVMDARLFNQLFVHPINVLLDNFFTFLSESVFPVTLPFESVLAEIPADASFITGVEGLIIADEPSSFYSSEFTNRGYPTSLKSISSQLVTGPTTLTLNDILADHQKDEIETNDTFSDITQLGDSTLKNILSMLISCRLDSVEGETITLIDGINDSLYIDFEIQFSPSGIDSAIINILGRDLEIPGIDGIKEKLNFSSNMPDLGDTKLDIISATMADSPDIPDSVVTGSDGFEVNLQDIGNLIKIDSLKSTFPWLIGFYLELPSFVPPAGGTPVLLDIVLSKDDTGIDTTFSLYKHTLAPTSPDTVLGSMGLDLRVSLPDQQATIPLDNSSLGGFGLDISFGSLFFEEFEAYINQTLVEDELEIPQYPPEMSGIGFPELEFEFEFQYSLNLPFNININLLGINLPADTTMSPLSIELPKPNELGAPPYSHPSGEAIKTIIRWNRLGSFTDIYAPYDSAEPDTTIINTPDQTSNEVSIVDFFAGMPYDSAKAQVNVRLRGGAEITEELGTIGGGFSIKLPLSVTMNTPAFIPPSGVSTLDTMDHDIRNKIRHSLIYSELNTTVENSFPLGGEFAILLSNKDYFPKDITSEALSAYVDTMAIREPDDWDSDDELYIVTDCESLSPARHDSVGGIYIFDVMSDSSECVEGVNYLVKTNNAGMDILVSYVDTLFRVILPDPDSLYQETNSEGHKGQVAVPGISSYSSVLDTGRIFLLTDYGLRYIVPRFSFNPTGDSERFFSRYDAIDIKSFITFRIASTGVLGATENDIVLKSPNGGERISSIDDSPYPIEWETYGDVSSVNIYYVEGPDPSINLWQEIVTDTTNTSTYPWVIVNTLESDSVRIIIKDSNSELYDISGWYFKVAPIITPRIATDNGILNNTRIKRPGKSR